MSHEVSVDLIVWNVNETFQDHDCWDKEDLFVECEAHICWAVVQIVKDVVLTDLIDANAVDGDTELGVGGSTAFPGRSD